MQWSILACPSSNEYSLFCRPTASCLGRGYCQNTLRLEKGFGTSYLRRRSLHSSSTIIKRIFLSVVTCPPQRDLQDRIYGRILFSARAIHHAALHRLSPADPLTRLPVRLAGASCCFSILGLRVSIVLLAADGIGIIIWFTWALGFEAGESVYLKALQWHVGSWTSLANP